MIGFDLVQFAITATKFSAIAGTFLVGYWFVLPPIRRWHDDALEVSPPSFPIVRTVTFIGLALAVGWFITWESSTREVPGLRHDMAERTVERIMAERDAIPPKRENVADKSIFEEGEDASEKNERERQRAIERFKELPDVKADGKKN